MRFFLHPGRVEASGALYFSIARPSHMRTKCGNTLHNCGNYLQYVRCPGVAKSFRFSMMRLARIVPLKMRSWRGVFVQEASQ
jgi:hypothetical protein